MILWFKNYSIPLLKYPCLVRSFDYFLSIPNWKKTTTCFWFLCFKTRMKKILILIFTMSNLCNQEVALCLHLIDIQQIHLGFCLIYCNEYELEHQLSGCFGLNFQYTMQFTVLGQEWECFRIWMRILQLWFLQYESNSLIVVNTPNGTQQKWNVS